MKHQAIERLETPQGILLRRKDPSIPTVLFVPQTMQLFEVEQSLANKNLEFLRDLLAEHQGFSIEPPIQPKPNLDIDNLHKRQAVLPVYIGRSRSATKGRQPHIGRLTLNISNNCNLWCSYCYADHGLYHAPKSMMEPNTAVEIINKVLDAYSSIGTVHFFGGEPLLNLPAINAVGNHLKSAYNDGRIRQMPQFVATTNGTLSSKRVMSTLLNWSIALTISWDGPQPIHDRNRPAGSGKSSYTSLMQSIKRFKAAGIPYQIECTYNKSHLEENLTIADLLQYFYQETGQRSIHIAPVALPSTAKVVGADSQRIFRDVTLVQQSAQALRVDEVVPLFAEAARVTVDNFFSGTGPMLSLAEDIIRHILTQRPNHTYCPAFFSQISIAVDGSVYPCFMFIGDPSFRFGNILTDEFPSERSAAVFDRYFREFGHLDVGTDCWYAPLFSGCVASDYITSNNLRTRPMAPMYEEVISECLVGVARNALNQ